MGRGEEGEPCSPTPSWGGTVSQAMQELIEIMHFTENVATKIHGLLDESEIYRTVKEEFAKSKRYNATIFLLTEDGSKLKVVETSTSLEKLRAAEKAAGLRTKEYKFDLNVSSILNQAVREGKTLQANISELIGELFPQPLAFLISKILGYEKRPFMATPLIRHGKIIGALAVSSTELAEYFIPSVRNLATHISTELELAYANTERKKAEEELLRLSNAVRISTDSIVIGDLDAKIIYVNEATLKMYGSDDKEDLIGKNSLDLIAPEDREKALLGLKEVLEKGYVRNQDYRIITKDGGRILVEMNSAIMKDAHGKPIGFAAISRDITERKRMESELRSSQERFRQITENAGEWIWEIDADGLYTYSSPTVEKVLGYKPEEIVGKKYFYELYPLSIAEKLSKSVTEIFAKKKTYKNLIISKVHKSGNVVTLEGSGIPILDEKGDLIGYRCAEIDITERKKMEEELKLRAELLDAATDSIFLRDFEGNILYANEAAYKTRGYGKDEFLKMKIQDLTAPEHAPLREKREKELMEKGEATWESAHIRKDKSIMPIESHARLIEVGERKLILNVVRDITRRKQRDEALRESEEKFRSIAERSFDAIFTANLEGRSTYMSPAIERISGYRPEEVVGKSFMDYFPKSEIPSITRQFAEVTKGGYAEGIQSRIIRKDGSLADIEVNASPIIREGKLVGTQGLIRDITERKLMDRMLVESEEKYRNLAEGLSECVYRADPETFGATYVNRAVKEMYGYTVEEWLKNPSLWENTIHSDDRERVLAELTEAKRKIKSVVVEYRIVRRNGAVRWVEDHVSLEKDEQGKLASVAGVVYDVTERKKAEEQLRLYSEHLEKFVEERITGIEERLLKAERLVIIGETAAMVGHDLRNPLQGIVGNVFLAKEKLKALPEEAKGQVLKNLETIAEQVKYMDKIVSDLQDYAKPLKPKLTPTDIRQLIDETLSTVKIPENIEFSSTIPVDFPDLMVDKDLMRRVLTNLVVNAVQAMPKGGKLRIRAEKTDKDALVGVEDTGVGISMENMGKLFEPLFTTKPKGQGLGLPVCKRIVEAHGGGISVESQVGKGSTFTIRIPTESEVR